MDFGSLRNMDHARTYPVSNVSMYPLTLAKNKQGVPQQPQLWLKKQVGRPKKIRVGSWNVGTLTGNGRELVDIKFI